MTNGRPWSSQDDATIRRMARAGYSDVEIGQRLGIDRQCVRRRRDRMGIAPGFSRWHRAALARLTLRRMCVRAAA